MKIKPTTCNMIINRNTTPMYQIGNPKPIYIDGQGGTIECTITLPCNNTVDYFINNSNKQHDLEIVNIKDNPHYIRNAQITSYDIDPVSNCATIDFVADIVSEITFDLLDKKNITIPRDSYDELCDSYGRPEDMYYDDFYTKYVAVEI